MTFPATRSRRRWRGSWAGAASLLFLISYACGSSETAATSPSPTQVVTVSPAASPTVDSGEAPVPQQVLPPATDPPLGNLCTAPVSILADGNVSPLLCKSGAVNVKAWQYYAGVSASVLGLGLNPTQGQVESAICDDYKHGHATKPEETSGYKLATGYYGWKFNLDPANVSCQ